MLDRVDYIVFFIYFLLVVCYGLYVYYRKKSKHADSKDFFLAEGSLTWWAIGASLIASNISAEQFIGMSGSGFAIGLAISSYEWMAAATLIVVAIFFIPIFLKNKIYTMPQFLSKRYNSTVSIVMAVFWLLVYIFVNLTSIIYLGSLAISSITGIAFIYCVYALGVFSIFVTLGGMKVIGYTDALQVLVLMIGGLITTYIALNLVSEHFGYGKDILKGFSILKSKAPSHFHMILDKTSPYYKDLPGLAVLIGGLWINNLNFWGFNQYIVQRALGADLKTARKGILFASFLKFLVPLITVIPGIVIFVLYKDGMFQQEMFNAAGNLKPDNAYPTLLNLLPMGIKGLAIAALMAAIISSIAGDSNSISTIFSLDIYQKFSSEKPTEKKLVQIGRWTVVLSTLIACLIVPALRSLDQAYQFVQEYVGFISPGVVAIFLMGFIWKRTTSEAALVGAILTIPLSALLKFLPAWTNGRFPDIPFLNRMSIVFIAIVLIMVAISLVDKNSRFQKKKLLIEKNMFKLSPGFISASVVIIGILVALYTIFW